MAFVPKSVEEIGDQWLTEVLASRFPGVRVEGSRQVDVIHGTCTKVRIALNSDDPRLPATLFAKAGYEPHSDRMRGMHQTETLAYQRFLPTVEANAPDCYFAGVDGDGRAIVLIEDLAPSNPRYLSLQQPISYELAASFLDELATMHARWWGRPALDDPEMFAWVPRPIEGRFLQMVDRLLSPEIFAGYVAAPRGAATPVALLDRDRIRAGLVAMRDSYRDQPKTIIHGDAHLNNLYVGADGRPGFLDWSVRMTPWQQEVSYFLTCALDVPDRREWEKPLIRHYLARLASLGVPGPDFPDAWPAYQRDTIWGFFIWLTNDSVFQTESANTAAAARFAAAMLDHNAFALLGV